MFEILTGFFFENVKHDKLPHKELIFFEKILIVSVFFPWVSFGLNDMDSQPWPIMGCLLYLLLKNKYFIEKSFYLLFFSVIASALVLAKDLIFDFSYFRSIISLATLVSVAYCISLLKKSGVFILKYLILINIVWIIAGFIQEIVSRDILDFLVVARTSEERGVTGLAPEPTFYAVFLIFNGWIILKEVDYRPSASIKLLLLLNVFVIIFLAKSSMGVIFLFVALVLFLIYQVVKNPVNSIYYLPLLTIVIYIIFQYSVNILGGTRLLNVISLMADPLDLIYTDASINQRVTHSVLSIKGFFDSYGVPNGLYVFDKYSEKSIQEFGGYLWSYPGVKIMSFSGSLLFELGWLGLIIFVQFVSFFWDHNNKTLSVVLMTAFFIFTLAAIPLAFTPVAILVGLHFKYK
jgi:hypothetical protein